MLLTPCGLEVGLFINLSSICPNLPCIQLFLILDGVFVFYGWRRPLSRCKHFSTSAKGPRSQPVSLVCKSVTINEAIITDYAAAAAAAKSLQLCPSDSSQPHGLQPTRLLRPWDFPGKSTGVGCHCLLQLLTIVSTFYRLSHF